MKLISNILFIRDNTHYIRLGLFLTIQNQLNSDIVALGLGNPFSQGSEPKSSSNTRFKHEVMQILGCGDTPPTLSLAYTRIVVHSEIHSVPTLAPCGASVLLVSEYVTLIMHTSWNEGCFPITSFYIWYPSYLELGFLPR